MPGGGRGEVCEGVWQKGQCDKGVEEIQGRTPGVLARGVKEKTVGCLKGITGAVLG